MESHILYPLKAPQHYRHKDGKHELQRFLYFYGARGSGKQMYVKSFCASNGLNLIVLDFASFEPLKHLESVYNTARDYQPCVILYDECEGYFQPNTERSLVGKLFAELRGVQDSYNLIWTVFISIHMPEMKLCHTILDMLNQHSHCGFLTERDRIKVLMQAISAHLYNDADFPLSTPNLVFLANVSEHCTPKQIRAFIDKVFDAKLSALHLQHLSTIERTETTLIPTIEDFRAQIISIDSKSPGRITLFDPYEMNVKAYGGHSSGIPYGYA